MKTKKALRLILAILSKRITQSEELYRLTSDYQFKETVNLYIQFKHMVELALNGDIDAIYKLDI